MKKYILLFLSIYMGNDSQSQSSVAGEYYLRGVMEVGSGFLLKPDSTFQFFFSYGALDREGSGKWRIEKESVVFNSRPRPAHDFALVQSKQEKKDSVTIRIVDNNQLLLQYVFVKVEAAGNVLEGMTNSHGEIRFPVKKVDAILLVFEFCPEKVSVFHPDPGHDYFEFRFEPWIVEYFFKDYKLRLDGNDLKGRHPMLDEKEYLFQKTK